MSELDSFVATALSNGEQPGWIGGRIDAEWLDNTRQVWVAFGQARTSIILTPGDAEQLVEKISAALAQSRPKTVPEPTESGMTELDLAVLQAKLSREAVDS